MPSPSARRQTFSWLLNKDWRELMASRAWWAMLLLTGPLVGFSFISAVRTYGEASGLNGTSAGVGEAFAPLDGVWAPTFSAFEIASTFLLPFVAIRLFGGDRQSGALKLELQRPLWPVVRVLSKSTVLLAGWGIASSSALIALALWKIYGGHAYVPEILVVAAGHLLNATLVVALAGAAAAVAEHPSTAAILTLAVTVGTWILAFVAAISGGLWERLAGYTPMAMVADFQRGLVRLDVVLVAFCLAGAGLGIATVWSRLGVSVTRRSIESAAIGATALLLVTVCGFARASWDVSEARRNSFSESDERALRQIQEPVRIEVHLAPEDPRRIDLDHQAISKLRRVLRSVQVSYVSATRIGLFEQTAPHYGEIWYDLGGRKSMTRLTTSEGTLEVIFALAGVTPQPESADDVFRGYPLAVMPKGAAPIFYGVWPAAVMGAGWLRRHA